MATIHNLEGRAKALEALNVFSSPRMGSLDERITDLVTNLLQLAESHGIARATIIDRTELHLRSERS
jgi:hypothetical protein